jgi:hypothetical protein
MFEDYDRGEKVQKAGMFRAKLIIFAVITVISLTVAAWFKWSKYSLHQKLVQHHEQTTAIFNNVYPNGRAPNIIYVITYTFKVNGKSYQNTAESRINPKYPTGIVWYDPEDPDENELHPVPDDEP